MRTTVGLALFLCVGLGMAVPQPQPAGEREKAPKVHDPRLVMQRFAAAPDIVHPINMAFDSRGRLLVIESHTHFRPAGYRGPPHDRIRMLEDTDGDGKADRFTTFFEGTKATMDIAVHADGSVYLATRNEILRLRDTDGDGKADQKQRIVFLDTKGDYPHNGLSGLAFDSKGDLYFGMGENLGANYKLIGSDGTVLADEGEGGNVFWCTADGKKLRRVATGFWNPFGVGTDIFGRVFAVDNDPDAMPPCRLLHVVEGGDYGYQFRYGRSGRHPFQSWHGELAGTLPMVSGTGEAPCKVLSYESDSLPPEYLGDLLVTSWADHRVERYPLTEKGASVVAVRKPFVQGGKDFRPVGLAVAPDGSLFVSDWVLRDYNLHGRGAVWHIRPRERGRIDRPEDPHRALSSMHRSLREAAARKLAQQGEAGRAFLREQLGDKNVRVRAAALTALIDAGDRKSDLANIAAKDQVSALRALAVRGLVARGGDARQFLDAKQSALVRAEAVRSLRDIADRPRLLQLLLEADPFLRHAAVQQLARVPELLNGLDPASLSDSRQRIGLLLAQRASSRPEAGKLAAEFFKDTDLEVRFLAAKWIADKKLAEHRPLLVEALKDAKLTPRLYLACATALARIDNRDVEERELAAHFLTRATDPKTPPALRAAALRLVPASHKKLTLDVLTGLLHEKDVALQLEAVRALNEHPAAGRLPVLLKIARDRSYAETVRAEALGGIAESAQEALQPLLELTRLDSAVLRDEALRTLVGVKLSTAQRQELEKIVGQQPLNDLAARALGRPFTKDRPRAGDIAAWLQRLDGPADAAAGRRVFFHPRLASCARCHRVDGRGQDVGPDLSDIGRTERRHILESILQPSNLIAPHYQVWAVEMTDGKVLTGMLVRTVLDEYTYVDVRGLSFKLNTRDIVETRAVATSLMPDGLVDRLTDQELRDLLAYLGSRR